MSIALDMSTYYKQAARFDAMTLRERALISAALLGILLMIWNVLLLGPLNTREQALQSELDEISVNMKSTADAMEQAMEPRNTALAQLKLVQAELADVDQQLSTTIAGMISPQHMAEVIRDVLHQQQGLTLISLRNQPVTPLIFSATPQSTNVTPISTGKNGPYVHPLQVVVEGSYMDIVAYLKALETMKWHVYWNRLELQTKHYPTNRVQIDMSTLSLDETWLGV